MRKDYIAISIHEERLNGIDFVEKFWTERWDSFDRKIKTESITKREEYRIIKPFLKNIPVRGRILDAGCGMGEWTVFLADQGYDAVGLDISEKTILRLKELLPDYQFIHGDIRKTFFENDSFDACISWGVFEHYENGMGDCLKEVNRILKPNGWLFMSVPYQNWRHILRDALEFHNRSNRYKKNSYIQPHRFYQWRFTKGEIYQELELRGFRVKWINPIHKPEGVGRFLDWDFRIFKSGTFGYKLTHHLFSYLLPAFFISHMIMAVAQKFVKE